MTEPQLRFSSGKSRVRERSRVGQGAIDIVLVSAREDEERLSEILPALERDGLSTRMIVGVEAAPTRLVAQLNQCEKPTLVVLCMSDALCGEALRHLVELFSANRASWVRLLVLEFERRRVHGLISSIRRARETLRQQLDMVQATPHGARNSAENCRVPEFADAVGDLGCASSQVIVDDPLRDEVGAIPEHVRVPGVRRPGPRLRIVSNPAEAPSNDPPVSSTPTARKATERVAFADARAEAEEAAFSSKTPPSAARRSRNLLCLMLLLGGLGLGSIGSASPRAETIASPEPAPFSSDLGFLIVPDLDIASAPPPPPVVDAPTTVEPIQLLVDEGKLLRSDHVLVDPPAPSMSDWWQARAHCHHLRIAGTRGWRLPTVYELRALRREHILRQGSYWSNARVERTEQPSNWVMDADNGVMAPLPKELVAQGVCVRRLP